MGVYSLTSLLAGIGIAIIGLLLLSLRDRVLRFVRQRFASVYREDGIPEAEIAVRFPKMAAVVVVGSGFVAFGVALVLVGLFSVMVPR